MTSTPVTTTPVTTTAELPAATVGELMTRPALQISDDVMVDTAMDILLGSGADHALVRDDEDAARGC
ncbi:hypothetical protein [Kitasatospora paranensis]|uniref:hypothetical protein n=1 Tax=Kitasatospora paranensis TaxID=258053 RepID=UPI0031E664E3